MRRQKMKKKIIAFLISIIFIGMIFVLPASSVDNRIKPIIGIFDSFEVIDQQQTSSADLGCPFFNNLWLAQEFIPSLDTITKVEVKLFKNNDLTSPIKISIRDSLLGSDLTSATIDGSNVKTYSKWFKFDFTDIDVIPGNTYFIVCRTSGGSFINYYCAEFDMYNPYSDGQVWGSFDTGANWDLIENHFPEYHDPDACFKTYGWDKAPNTPTINGEINGDAGVQYPYTITGTDPEGHNLLYYVKWGDGSTSGWVGEYPSGQAIQLQNSWNSKGTYTIQVKAKDIYGLESGWGSLTVTMPKNKMMFTNSIIMRLFERYPNAFPLLRQLFI
jgi:hypothetical protein